MLTRVPAPPLPSPPLPNYTASARVLFQRPADQRIRERNSVRADVRPKQIRPCTTKSLAPQLDQEALREERCVRARELNCFPEFGSRKHVHPYPPCPPPPPPSPPPHPPLLFLGTKTTQPKLWRPHQASRLHTNLTAKLGRLGERFHDRINPKKSRRS